MLHRGGFFGGRMLPTLVSGTCAREEGLRTLTSPRREASLFKLGRNQWFRPFSLPLQGSGPRRAPVGWHAGPVALRQCRMNWLHCRNALAASQTTGSGLFLLRLLVADNPTGDEMPA